MGTAGRADLLRRLAAAPCEDMALQIDQTGWFGYVRQEETASPGQPFTGPRRPNDSPAASEPGGYRLPLRMPFAWTAVDHPVSQTAVAENVGPPSQFAGPLQDTDTTPLSDRIPIPHEDLVPHARLLPALRRYLNATRGGGLDVGALIANLASGRMPRRLPRLAVRRWHPDLVVFLDFSDRLWPYRADMHRLAARLHRLCGRSGVSLRVLSCGPFGSWTDWVEAARRRIGEIPRDRALAMPLARTPVLIVSDLGRLQGSASPAAQSWDRFITMLGVAQVRPMVLAPLGVQQLDGALARSLPVIRWSPDAAVHPARGEGETTIGPEGLDDLLAMVAAVRRVDPPLLRAMRRLNPVAPQDAALEGLVWCHGDVEAGFAATVKIGRQARYLERFRTMLPQRQLDLASLRKSHHAHLAVTLNHEEGLLWWACAAEEAKRRAPEVRRDFEKAITFLWKLCHTFALPETLRVDGDWPAVARGIWRRAANTDLPDRFGVLRQLAKCLSASGPGVGPAHATTCYLVQDARKGWLSVQAVPPGPGQSSLGGPLALDGSGIRIQLEDEGRWLLPHDLPAGLLPLDAPGTVALETYAVTRTVAPVRRPRGAYGWSLGRDELAVQSPPFVGQAARWVNTRLHAEVRPDARHHDLVADLVEAAAREDGPTTIRFGMDSPFGVFADLTINTKSGNARQEFRWIEPGTFWMGSPEDELERDDDEGPQHAVTLTRGFWLADTACTQALWQAVMGQNPSDFRGPDRPVEQVSWHDVQAFLRRLEGLVPGCDAGLPSEAEWEYACRAGTTTPFSFGATITPAQVNYDGNFPYDGGDRGEFRQQTVAVKSLPPNAWGLYEMHGNVWEWCADGLRTDDGAAQVDPRGPEDLESETAPRVYRGGSWIGEARAARSAFRLADHPGRRSPILGFRLSLRSREPSQVPGRHESSGRPRPPTGGRSGAPGGRRSRKNRSATE